MVPRIQGLPVTTSRTWNSRKGLCGRPGAGQGESSSSHPGPFSRREQWFPRQQHQAPSHSDPETLLQKEAKGCSYPALRAELLPFSAGLRTFSALHVLPDILVGER